MLSSVNTIAQDIKLQRMLSISRNDTFKAKENLFFLCVHIFLIYNVSFVYYLGQNYFPLEAIWINYHKAFFL